MRRTAERLLTLIAVGEVFVGLVLVIFPGEFCRLALEEPLDAAGAVGTRVAGFALMTIGAAWWGDRRRLEPQRLKQVSGGVILYNLGVGLLFLYVSLTAVRSLPFAWIIAVAHLLVGGAFVLFVARTARPA